MVQATWQVDLRNLSHQAPVFLCTDPLPGPFNSLACFIHWQTTTLYQRWYLPCFSGFQGSKRASRVQLMPCSFHQKPALIFPLSLISFSKPLFIEEKNHVLIGLSWFVLTKTLRKNGPPTALQALPAPRVLEKPGPLAAAPPSMAPPSLPGRFFESKRGVKRRISPQGYSCRKGKLAKMTGFGWVKYC